MSLLRRLTFGIRKVHPDEELSVVEHLEELRRRIIVSIVALAVTFTLAWIFQDQLMEILIEPLPGDQDQLITLSPTEPFMVVLKVCFGAAVVAALPIWLYQLYAYVIPAVGTQSRRVMLLVVGAVSALFVAGVAFGYFLVLPLALNWLQSFGDQFLQNELRAGEYFSFALALLLGSGLVFEVPIAMLALAKIGVVTAGAFKRGWRIAIVVIAVVAAVMPGGDPFSMIVLMIPMLILYQVGIWLAGAFGGEPLFARLPWANDGPSGPPSA